MVAFFLLNVVAEIVVLPFPTPVTIPLEETVATALLLERNVTLLLYPLVNLIERRAISFTESFKFPF